MVNHIVRSCFFVRRWMFTVVMGFSLFSSATAQCEKEEAAYDEVLLRARASQIALESLRKYRGALDDAIIETRASDYADAVVDLAAMAAEWPIGTMAEKAILGEVKNSIIEKIFKASIGTVDKALLKDPTLQGLISSIDVGSGYTEIELAQRKELAKNLLIEGLGEEAGSMLFGVWDTFWLSKGVYDGHKRLDALHKIRTSVENQIRSLEERHGNSFDVLNDAKRARDHCRDRVAQHLPPDPNNPFWKPVAAYLGPRWTPPRSTNKPGGKDDKFVGSWKCTCKITIQLGSDYIGRWIDSRGGPPGSMWESGTFSGTWAASGTGVVLSISKNHGDRSGVVHFSFRDGTLVDPWGQVYVKDSGR